MDFCRRQHGQIYCPGTTTLHTKFPKQKITPKTLYAGWKYEGRTSNLLAEINVMFSKGQSVVLGRQYWLLQVMYLDVK